MRYYVGLSDPMQVSWEVTDEYGATGSRKPNYTKSTFISVTQSTGNFRWTVLGLNSELHREKQDHTSPTFGTFLCAQHKYQCHVLIALTRFFLKYKLQDYSRNCCASCLSFCLYINRSASTPRGKRKDQVHNSVTLFRL